jgi:hypothetical protein
VLNKQSWTAAAKVLLSEFGASCEANQHLTVRNQYVHTRSQTGTPDFNTMVFFYMLCAECGDPK